ncbi:Dyp-type peroxidase [uncultured Aquimarina sp.]|uniref:Dyp-type peroxidase n=1 Tax=uncultured Aquimarina sp. TaxID=575652 RepID=UPI002629EBDE|nr:Dyp-type peroxidase [uncultured Aquimarina sp.]
MLQEGIFWQNGVKPGQHLGIMFIKLDDEAKVDKVYNILSNLWDLYEKLKSGIDPYVPNVPIPASGLTCTIGYGKNIFDKFSLLKDAPQGLLSNGKLRSPKASGGGKILRGSGLSYAENVTKNNATEDIMVQFTANSVLAVNRAIVYSINEMNKEEYDSISSVSKFYTGFHREDSRSWIGFHDGISNLKSGSERKDVVSIKPGISQDGWVENGTYMFFLRINVDIEKWNTIPLDKQELLVGRKKGSGCPIDKIENGKPHVENGCPLSGSSSIVDRDSNGEIINNDFFEPPITTDETVKVSHVQRANQHRGPVSDRNSLRIFRQGYEFLEANEKSPGYSAGLNFISFQDTPERVTRMLTQPSWLGNINFGGYENEQGNLKNLLEVVSGGVYLIPPMNLFGKIPGYELFEEETVANNV